MAPRRSQTTAAISATICFLLVLSAQAQGLTAINNIYLPLVVNVASTPTATISPTPTLPPPSFVNCATPPNAASAPNYPIAITAINKNAETVTLQNVSTSTIDLTNWRMCSITGGQTHPISGTLAPGESRVFTNLNGLIWNNLDPDPGALYTPDGRLASYRDA